MSILQPRDLALREFHISKLARDHYQFDQTLFSLTGNVIFANFRAARIFAQKMNDKRDLVNFPEKAVRAGQINAMGLIDEILHYVITQYRKSKNPQAIKNALVYLEKTLTKEAVDKALQEFCEEFPPVAVYQGKVSLDTYLSGETEGTPHREVALEEMLLLWLANTNPAFEPFMELFDDNRLDKLTAYPNIMKQLHTYFETQPRFGPDNQNLIDMLRTPALKHPHSLEEQLDYIRSRWITVLGSYLYRLLSSLDFLAEENKMFFGFGPGPETFKPYEFGAQEEEIENFSPDSDWMPRLVLIAKNTYVWLHQLSQEYGQQITRLDQVPDAELDKLHSWGITGLWLIGLWERSEASKRIKQIMGNPEAVASAYSLKGYRIANDLGGEEAYQNLKDRAWRRGVRMASDMVPNHMGIDSDWVIHHPDWFVGLDYPPFPGYTYNGTDLCEDERVGVYIEDHYYTHSDAAVTFKRVDHWTGSTKYIYHGNDGTSMPWNDTAQLNYLMPEVREAVIQTILDVARRSPIIRFDAAMTLAKRHYQRLWFPQPGTGGDIPSRADYAMTKEAFDAAMPEEFWREVVDRIATEAPDTLLLAEAFWMMEGYFVRTLGMHRVYNSAFMNMLRDEKNAEYRQLIKNTLEFDPQILKRYVNFMNNPDERTAVDQFGKGDKYFGICTMMATMPGLPMFGHGQVEGYAEKYGMEFRRAYWQEQPDPWLVERHQRQIFPILHERYRFAEVDNFLLYDFYTADGNVDENVFAYSNNTGGKRSLVLYHNKYAETTGWIRTSAAVAVKGPDGEKELVQKSLSEGLSIPYDEHTYLIFRDAMNGMEYIRNAKDLCERGLYAELHAYQSYVFVDFREVHDNEWRQYGQLHRYLNGKGVPNIDEALKELFLEPVHAPFRMLVSAPAFKWLIEAQVEEPGETVDERILSQVEKKMIDLLTAIENAAECTGDAELIAQEVRDKLDTILALPVRLAGAAPEETEYAEAVAYLTEGLEDNPPEIWGTILGLLFTHALGKMVSEENFAEISRSWIDEWLLGKLMANALQEMEVSADDAWRAVAVSKIMLSYPEWLKDEADQQQTRAYRMVHAALGQREIQAYLGINRYQGILWFNKESFEEWLWWLMYFGTLDIVTSSEQEDYQEAIANLYGYVSEVQAALEVSKYQVARLLEALSA